jgi:hypothetical protein
VEAIAVFNFLSEVKQTCFIDLIYSKLKENNKEKTKNCGFSLEFFAM